MTHIIGHISRFDSTLDRGVFCLHVIASGYAWKQHYYYTQTWPHCLLYSCTLPSPYTSRSVLRETSLSHALINQSQSEGFLRRAAFLTWKLALNSICTGRHIFGRSSSTADRENEPPIPHNVAWLLSYLPSPNSSLVIFCTLRIL